MIYGSVCSGIESATVAWHPLGWRAAFFAEIEPFPSAMLAHHYPEVTNLGDITRFHAWGGHSLDVLVGGTPCQSFSVAGLRAGLDDPRGNLMLTFLAIAERYRPRWVVWENVPGVLSIDDGRAFGALLLGLAVLGYGFAYRVLDAQYFRLAQRRKRVFVVGSLRGWPSAAAVLFERASLSGNPAPRREARKDVAGTIAGGARKRSRFSYDDIPLAGTVKASDHKRRPECDSGQLLVARCVTAREGMRHERETLIAVDYTNGLQSDIAGTLEAAMDRGNRGHGVLCFDETQITNPDNRCNPQAGDPSHPLAAGTRPPTIAFDCKASGRNGFGVGEIAPTLRAMGHKDTHQNAGGQVAVAFQERGRSGERNLEIGGDISYALTAPNGGGRSQELNICTPQMAVRRLTPRECERLQGFEDDYTLIQYRGKLAKDGPRYKALGNSKAVPCVRWIGQRIAAVDAILRERAA